MQKTVEHSTSAYGRVNEDDAIVGEFIADRQAIHLTSKTGNNFVDGVLTGYAWSGTAAKRTMHLMRSATRSRRR
jgi:hypothetical protein